VVDAAEIAPHDCILEVGTGLGRLTRMLAERGAAVVSVEIDDRLHELAGRRLQDTDNTELLHCDFLAGKHQINPEVVKTVGARLSELGRETVNVVSNLPYGISSPALMTLLEGQIPVARMSVMLQRDVGERLLADPGGDQYGALTVFADYWASTRELFRMPPQAFWPQPKVSSSFLRIAPRTETLPVGDYGRFSEVVNCLFQNRRKTLRRGLRLCRGRETEERVLEDLDLSEMVRPEKLSVEDFAAISRTLDG
jgi:16S rRNA (adenine1518-N6/adenine1519-N6)-dimethyltransferase